MIFSREEVLKGLKCCTEFLCDECPYQKFYHDEYKFRCSHFMIRDIEALLTDIPEVIRCKDCNNSIECDSVLYCTYFNKNVDEDGFCSEGC